MDFKRKVVEFAKSNTGKETARKVGVNCQPEAGSRMGKKSAVLKLLIYHYTIFGTECEYSMRPIIKCQVRLVILRLG